MAGYSGTPLLKKLGIKPGHALAAFRAPDGFEKLLGRLPEGCTFAHDPRGRGPFDVVIFFPKNHADYTAKLDGIRSRLAQAGGLWIAWPKKASGIPTDLTENAIRDVALAAKLVDNKVCAIDDTYSGLRLVIPLKCRE